MKSFLLTAFFLSSLFVSAQTETAIKSTIKEVTVFNRGAELTRTAAVNLKVGNNLLVFRNLSPVLDEKSLQFSAEGSFSVLALNYEIRYNEQLEKKQQAANLNKQLGDLADEVKIKKDRLAICVSEEQVLVNNTDFDTWTNMNVAQLEQGVDFVKRRLILIKQEKHNLRNEIEELNKKRQKTVNELQEIRITESKPEGVVLVKVLAEKAQNLTANLSYVVADATWEPYYDLRVENTSSPLNIQYKAKVSQNTGEDWDDVKLALSTGNPYEDGKLPVLNPWYLNYSSSRYNRAIALPAPQRNGITGTLSGIVVDNLSAEAIPYANVVALNQNGNIISGISTDVDGKFKLELKEPAQRLEVSFIGYNKYSQILNADQFYTVKLSEASEQLSEVVISYERPRRDKSNSSSTVESEAIYNMATRDVKTISGKLAGVSVGGKPSQFGDAQEFKISQNPVNLKFEVALPYDVPSDGQQYRVAIKEYAKEADYLYQAVPKLNKNAFLTAEITEWEELNLLDGSAGIYYEGTYLGETELKVSEASDTLKISLGKDQNIVVQRNTAEETESKSFLSGKRSERFHYVLQVRNNKTGTMRLEIKDQFPISGNTEITVDREESTGGKVDDKTGIVTWDVTLQPKDEKKIDLIYTIKYPKNRTINVY